MSGVGCEMSGVGCRVSSVEPRGCGVSSVECQVSGVGCRVSGWERLGASPIGFWVSLPVLPHRRRFGDPKAASSREFIRIPG
eukprot:956641-Amorphochlora_amoeboformis.AAC.1